MHAPLLRRLTLGVGSATLALTVLCGSAMAADGLVDALRDKARDVATDCRQDANKYCKRTDPGSKKELNCLRDHEDKLSKQCRVSMRNFKRD